MELPRSTRWSFHNIAHGDRDRCLHDSGSATALVVDVHLMDARYTPYQRPPDRVVTTSPIPRGLKSFVVPGAVLAAKPLYDKLMLSFSFSLPHNYAYLLNELNVSVDCDTASDWDDVGHLRLPSTSTANRGFDYQVPLDFTLYSRHATGPLGTAGQTMRSTQINSGQLPRTPIVPTEFMATSSMIFCNRVDAAQAAGTVDALISFWEFDLEQIQFYPIHMAANVVAR